MTTSDFLIIGAGIIGLAMARELRQRYPQASIAVLEKEPEPGRHASGRNSGVLHSGIYYPEGSFKARVCAQGKAEMEAYCRQHGLPLARHGKVIVPTRAEEDSQLDLLLQRSHAAGAQVELIDAQQLAEIEPTTHTPTGRALFAPGTGVIDAKAVLRQLIDELREQRVTIHFNQAVTGFDAAQRQVHTASTTYQYGHLVNASGAYADRVAHQLGAGTRYTALPFKGIYYKLDPACDIKPQRLIYPVPDLNVPFLGVHFTRGVDGTVYVGPSAMPALGREHYRGLAGLRISEALPILSRLAGLYLRNPQNFRRFAHAELAQMFRSRFAASARRLVPATRTANLLPSNKRGIRPQLFDLQTGQLEMDFVVEHARHATHILNAISPAFTSSFRFARVVADEMHDKAAAA